ncbi:MAG: tripartite tricarboxylate transporter permease [Mailhella sp.]|nr:tripartite tricarboxylate transporter permease [Mailhella sp.]
MENLLNALPEVFTWLNMLVLLTASMGGLFFGAMPGLSPTMAVALLVPFTFYLPPTTSLIMLGAVYTSAVAGGCLSAILLSIPGAPASIATLLDGPAMAKNGRAEEALYTAFISSFVGGLFGVAVLIFFAPPLAEFAMRFGPSELFWTAIFGITVITGLSSGGMFKGLFAGALGMMLSTVGYSQISGEPRFVFHPDLASGIALVPALIGFFAVPQIIDLMRDAHMKLVKLEVKSQSGVLAKSFRQHLHMKKTLSLGSIIGTLIGIIPGAGGQIAGLMVYDQVKKMDKNPGRFGTGDPEGVCASESANNATVGPALVPLLTLGIPGSPTAAVLLGGLLIHGLFPGPDLFTKHADVTYTFLIGLFLAQFFMLLVGILASKYSHYVANVPNHIMFAAVAILCVFGSYCVSNNFADVLIMFSLGMIMLFLGKLSFPSAPLVLGLILGPIAEELPPRQHDRQYRRRPLQLLLYGLPEHRPHHPLHPQPHLGHCRRNQVQPHQTRRRMLRSSPWSS